MQAPTWRGAEENRAESGVTVGTIAPPVGHLVPILVSLLIATMLLPACTLATVCLTPQAAVLRQCTACLNQRTSRGLRLESRQPSKNHFYWSVPPRPYAPTAPVRHLW